MQQGPVAEYSIDLKGHAALYFLVTLITIIIFSEIFFFKLNSQMEWAHEINYQLNTLTNFSIRFKDWYIWGGFVVSWILFFDLIFFFFWIVFYCVYLSWEFRFMYYLSACATIAAVEPREAASGWFVLWRLLNLIIMLVDVRTSNCQSVPSRITLMDGW